MIGSLISGTIKILVVGTATVVVVGVIMASNTPSVDTLRSQISENISSGIINNVAQSTRSVAATIAGSVVGGVSGSIISNIAPIETYDLIFFKVAQIAGGHNGPKYIGAFNRWFQFQ